MLNARRPLVHALPVVAACLVFGSSTAFASSLIGSRNSSVTLDLGSNITAYITGLTASEAGSVTASNYLSIIHPYDAEKTGLYDTNLCWAATSANMLAYTGWGNVNGFQTEDDILAYYAANFTDMPGNQQYANEWFLSGNYQPTDWAGWAQLTTAGGGNFWPGVNVSYDYVNVYEEATKLDSLLTYLQDGNAVSLMLAHYDNGQRSYGHAVTAWGATYDNATGHLVSLLISDSDNDYGDGAFADDTLHEIFLVFDAVSGHYSFSNYYPGGVFESFNTLASAVPEPSVYLMFGLGILTMTLMRRKKKQ